MFDDSMKVLIKPKEAVAEFKAKANKRDALKNFIIYGGGIALLLGLVSVLQLVFSGQINSTTRLFNIIIPEWIFLILIQPVLFIFILLIISALHYGFVSRMLFMEARLLKFSEMFYIQSKLILPFLFLILTAIIFWLIPTIGRYIWFIPLIYTAYLAVIIFSEITKGYYVIIFFALITIMISAYFFGKEGIFFPLILLSLLFILAYIVWRLRKKRIKKIK